MKPRDLHIKYQRAESKSELNREDLVLFEQAIDAMSRAYAPYSKFNVGCALLLENGEIIQGNNQENIAYPSGLCAERVALFAGASKYPNMKVKALAVATSSLNEDPSATVSPCGACRQVMIEYERKQPQSMRIISGAANGVIDVFESASALLPLAFFDSNLSL